LGDEPDEALSSRASATERKRMVSRLGLDAGAMTSRPPPEYCRDRIAGLSSAAVLSREISEQADENRVLADAA